MTNQEDNWKLGYKRKTCCLNKQATCLFFSQLTKIFDSYDLVAFSFAESMLY
ncbi:hypothetical protein HMPREF1345_00870 [Enterococcus faecium TX1337RF]|nr:hypothetical protein HMPREF1345_00870 [Enterococcus faecium TX1337RF]MBL5008334.1 hypothetical protein [Enterococcus lactis]